ncbi:T6SS effector BTH_I2691 family protein [Pectobacterium sp. B1J-3]|uniref:T6SS effector BTH_I2691 family protein n=1 Tax=Pectobacterium sp. B1J-3 TaxID=3385371 RepID=UPI003906C4C4
MNNCKHCLPSGLAILPVSYVVVPDVVKVNLPAWANNNRITGNTLSTGYHYALRTLRRGYLYLYQEKLKSWEVYAINNRGQLHKQPDVNKASPMDDKFECGSPLHNPVNLEYFCVTAPEWQEAVWVAYTEYKWSEKTLARYQQDERLRAKRMQKISLSTWIVSAQQQSATEATKASLQQVLDFNPDFQRVSYPDNISVSMVSELPPDNKSVIYHKDIVNLQTTRYPWATTQAREPDVTLAAMKKRSPNPEGGSYPVMLLALPDALGIAAEMNGWLNEASARLIQFGEELKWEVNSDINLTLIKGVLQSSAKAGFEKRAEIYETQFQKTRGGMLEAYQRSRETVTKKFADDPLRQQQEMRVIALKEKWHNAGVSEPEIWKLDRISRTEPGFSQELSRRENEMDERLRQRDASRGDQKDQEMADSWEKYLARLNRPLYNSFQQTKDQITRQVMELREVRANQLSFWLQSDIMLTTLKDFHPEDVRDGVQYERVYNNLTLGMNETKAGDSLLDKWLAAYTMQDEKNLFWRAFALNQQAIIDEIEPLLIEVKKEKTAQPQDEIEPASTVNEDKEEADALARFIVISNQLKDACGRYIYALTEHDKLPQNATKVEKFLNKIDNMVVNAGSRVFNPGSRAYRTTGRLADPILKGLLLLRAGVEKEVMLRVVTQEIKAANDANRDTTELMKKKMNYKEARAEVLRRAKYRNLTSSLERAFESEGGEKAAKLSRLNAALAVFNLVDLVNCLSRLNADTTADKEALAKALQAAGYTAAAFAEVALSPLELMKPELTKTLGGIKVLAGGAMSFATYFNVKKYSSLMINNFDNGDIHAGFFYLTYFVNSGLIMLKASGQLSSGLGVLLGKVALEKAGQKMATFFAAKILVVALSWQVQMGLVIVELIYDSFKKNELEKWCLNSRFGQESIFLKPGNEYAYRNSDKETEELEKAYEAMGWKEKTKKTEGEDNNREGVI